MRLLTSGFVSREKSKLNAKYFMTYTYSILILNFIHVKLEKRLQSIEHILSRAQKFTANSSIPQLKSEFKTCNIVTSIVVEQDCFQTELRIAGNSNKLVYFHKLTSRIYSTKLLHI